MADLKPGDPAPDCCRRRKTAHIRRSYLAVKNGGVLTTRPKTRLPRTGQRCHVSPHSLRLCGSFGRASLAAEARICAGAVEYGESTDRTSGDKHGSPPGRDALRHRYSIRSRALLPFPQPMMPRRHLVRCAHAT